MITSISFDLWNTLIFSNPEYRIKRNIELLKHCKIYTTSEELDNVFKKFKNDIDSSVEKFGIQYKIEDVYNILSNLLGIDADKIRIISEEMFLNNLPILRPGVLELLKTLSQNHYSLCISSNTVLISGNVLYRALHKLGINDYMDFHLFSDQLGYSKPKVEFFIEVQTKFAQLKHTIVHVGDNTKTDIYGARDYGFRTIFVKKEENIETYVNNSINSLINAESYTNFQ